MTKNTPRASIAVSFLLIGILAGLAFNYVIEEVEKPDPVGSRPGIENRERPSDAGAVGPDTQTQDQEVSDDFEIVDSDTTVISTGSANYEIPAGIFAMISGGKPTPQSILDSDIVSGITLVNKWKEIEVTEGVFDWSYLDGEIAKAEASGKSVRLAVAAGGRNTPSWVYDYDVETFSFGKDGVYYNIPLFWDSVFLNYKTTFLKELANRYNSNESVVTLSAPCVDANTGDWNPGVRSDEEIQDWLNKGYTPDKLLSACKFVMDTVMQNAPNKLVVTAIGPMSRKLGVDSESIPDDIVDYGNEKYPGRLVLAKGALNTKTPNPDSTSNLMGWQSVYDQSPLAFAQMVWFVSNDKTCRVNAFDSPCDAKEMLTTSIHNAAALNIRMVEVYQKDVEDPELIETVSELNQYLKDL